VLGSNSAFASSSKSNSASRSLEHNIEIHAENTGKGVVLDAQINVFLNAKAEVSSIREVLLLQLSILDLKPSFKDFISLVSTDSDVNCNFLVTLDVEATNNESGS
jgi:hypothetical protein